ncbi:MAG: sortase [Eubacteriaceae bacterium]|nr:sortase [Eubacteriaceae bacterium]
MLFKKITHKFKFASRQKKIIILLSTIALCCILVAAGITINKYCEGIKAQQEAQKMLEYYNSAVDKESKGQIEYEGYEVIGKLIIDNISLSLPIISPYSVNALSTSVCYYQGSLPGQDGNMVITGHNYASGAHFGNLDKLRVGDKVMLETPGGQKYEYTVYNIEVINPDNTAALYKYEGNSALTLLTCTSNGNRRLLVRCKIE